MINNEWPSSPIHSMRHYFQFSRPLFYRFIAAVKRKNNKKNPEIKTDDGGQVGMRIV